MIRQTLLGLIFLLNFSLFAFEMLLPRVMAPFLGSSHWIWALVIAGVLIGMSIGYYGGEKLKWIEKINQPLTLSLYAAALSLLWALSPWVLTTLLRWGIDVFLPDNNLWGLVGLGLSGLWTVMLAATLTLLSPAAYQHLIKAGYSIGYLFILSTFASLLGIFLQSFLFITLLGTLKSFLLISLLWLIGTFLCWLQNKQMSGSLSIFVAALVLNFSKAYCTLPINHPRYPKPFELGQISHLFNPHIRTLVHLEESPYNLIRVYHNKVQHTWELMLNEPYVIHSSFYEQKSFAPRFNDYLFVAAGVPHLKASPSKNLLMLGAAAGSIITFAQHYFPELNLTGVEIDSQLLKVGEKFFHLNSSLKSPKATLVVADARSYLNRSQQKFDFILVDTFSGGTIPAHLASTEFFALLKSRLKSDGLIGINVPVVTLKDDLLVNLWQSTRTFFKHIYLSDQQTSRLFLLSEHALDFVLLKNKKSSRSPYSEEYLNFFEHHLFDLSLYFETVGIKKGLAYSDDLAPVEWDSFKGYLQLL